MIKDMYQFGGLQDQQRRYLVSVTYYDDTHPFANVADAGLYFSENVPDMINDKDWKDKLTPVWQDARKGPRGGIAGWDPDTGMWISITQSSSSFWKNDGGRNISRWTSKDLQTWSEGQVVLPIAKDESRKDDDWVEYYTMQAYRISGVWLGFLTIFHSDRTSPQYQMPGRPNIWRKGTTDARLMISRDAGASWKRVAGKQVWIPHHEKEDGYDRTLYLGCPVRVDDELWIYYWAHDGDHLVWNRDGTSFYKNRKRIGRTALATLRWDGYISLDAGEETGQLVTKLLRFKGDKLWVNIDASKGALKVELQDEKGRAIPDFALEDCLPVKENGINLSVSWQKGKLNKLAGRAIKVRFELENASLFAFGFIN